MIAKTRKYGKLFFSSLLRQIKYLTFVAVAVSLFIYFTIEHDYIIFKITLALPGLLSVSLGLLLVFRNNTAYDKWWEGRKEVGSLVNNIRNLSLEIATFLSKEDKDEKVKFTNGLISYAYQLKKHLRSEQDLHLNSFYEIPESENIVKNSGHKPLAIMYFLQSQVQNLFKIKKISEIQMQQLTVGLTNLIDIIGRCERIKNTPIPIAYAFLLKMFIFIYVLILPLALVHDIGWVTLPIVLMIQYVLMSIITTAEEIEDPFGYDLNDLPMDDITKGIEKTTKQIADQF